MTARPEELIDVEELTHEQGTQLFDQAARRELGISGEEFLRRWDAGEYSNSEEPAVVRLSMLIPFAR